jgi:predicted solute-binding protein
VRIGAGAGKQYHPCALTIAHSRTHDAKYMRLAVPGSNGNASMYQRLMWGDLAA